MPILGEAQATLRLVSGAAPDLLARLARHELDLVLANRPAKREPGHAFRSRRVAKQEVSVVGRRRARRFRFPDDLASAPMILPGPDSELRAEFDALCEQLGVKVKVRAEVDDMALMRLLVRDGDALALVPSVVVRDELRTGALRSGRTFHAIFIEVDDPASIQSGAVRAGFFKIIVCSESISSRV